MRLGSYYYTGQLINLSLTERYPLLTPGLRDHLFDALLHHGWDVYHGKWMVHKYDWVGTTDMDTQVPSFEDLIVEQAARHLEKLPAFEGIAIDRLDYSEFFNYDFDDHVSWIPTDGTRINGSSSQSLTIWGPARALRLSYRHTYNRLHEVLHLQQPPGKKKLILSNCNLLCRLDEMRSMDGTFSEGAGLNGVAWTGLRNPSILWTYSLPGDVAALDTYFQQHLLMDVYPMAPMPKNDHSITPGSAVVEQGYIDYAPLFNAMHGARWVLTARPATLKAAPTPSAAGAGGSNPDVRTVSTGAAAPAAAATAAFGIPNVLTTPSGGFVVPIMLANTTTASVILTLRLPGVTALTLKAIHPGRERAVELGPAKRVGAALEATVPLHRGCALVLAEQTA